MREGVSQHWALGSPARLPALCPPSALALLYPFSADLARESFAIGPHPENIAAADGDHLLSQLLTVAVFVVHVPTSSHPPVNLPKQAQSAAGDTLRQIEDKHSGSFRCLTLFHPVVGAHRLHVICWSGRRDRGFCGGRQGHPRVRCRPGEGRGEGAGARPRREGKARQAQARGNSSGPPPEQRLESRQWATLPR
ncbi:unnamed protein product [Ectocarpus sp. 6 AP-2014]